MNIVVDVDHRHQLGGARDQRRRPTCLAFAASAAHEANRGSTDYFSPEYLFYSGAQRSHKDPDRGLTFSAVCAALQHDGQPGESDWPYLPATPTIASWKPPAAIGPIHTGELAFNDRTVPEVRISLQGGNPILLIIRLTDAMYHPQAGGVVRPSKSDRETARHHAVLAVGVGRQGRSRFILIRNSWGSGWGDSGHGWLPEAYLSKQLVTTATIG